MVVHDTLVRVVMDLSAARDLQAVMATVRQATREITGADGATFVLREGDLCHYADEDAIGPLWKGQRFPAEGCISGWVMKHKLAAVVEDISTDPRIPQSVYESTFVRSLAMVPIRSADPLGAIGAYWAQPHRAQPEEVRLIQAIADSTAVALENVRALDEARRWRALLEEASDTVWTMDPGTGTGEMGGVGRWWTGMTGRTPAFYANTSGWLEDLHPEDRDAVASAWAASLQAPVPFRTQYRVLTREGGLRYVSARAVAVPRPGGTHELVGMISDVTREREAEREIHSLLDRERTARSAMDQLLERISDGFAAIDRQWRYSYVNKRASELLGRKPEELVGQHVWTLFPEARGGPFHLAMERALATQQVVSEEHYFGPWGRWFENRIYASESGFSIFFTDVTEKREGEENRERLQRGVEAEKRRLERLAECVPAAIVMVAAPSGKLISSNRRAFEVFGDSLRDLEKGRGHNSADQETPAGQGALGVIAHVLATGAALLDREISYVSDTGRIGRLLASAVPVEDHEGQLEAVVASFHDVTEGHEVREALRQLSRRLLTAQDEERRRISRDLHDDLAQVLTAVKMSLAVLAPNMAPAAFDASVRNAIESVDRSIRQTRDLSLSLHPPMLDILGLAPTLRWYLAERLRGPSPAVHVTTDIGQAHFAAEVENACFRVVQEAVTNVLRHARARQIWVQLREEPGALIVLVKDDGCGFEPVATRARAAREKSAGLAGMQERVALAGGSLELTSKPGNGTQLCVRFPLERRA